MRGKPGGLLPEEAESGVRMNPRAKPASGGTTGWFAWGGALIALAGHLELIRRFGTVLPYRDPWQIIGWDLLGPWVDGTLSPAAFWVPVNDHWPVLTRLLEFGLILLNGQWNNLVEVVINAALLVFGLGLFLKTALTEVRAGARFGLALLAGFIFALPITWENTLWGIQSLPYWQILLTLVYFHALVHVRRFDRWWWTALVAGGLVLLSQRSAMIAQVAALPLLGWRIVCRDGDRRALVAAGVVAVLLLAAFGLFFPALEATAVLRADSWPIAIEVGLRQLAWPTGHPAWAFVIWGPWGLLAVEAAWRRRWDAGVAILLVTGLWVGGQAAAIAYGRGVTAIGYVSRYGDLLALGVVVNAACWVRVWQAHADWRRWRPGLLLLGLLMTVVLAKGLWWETMHSHTYYKLSRRSAENAANLQRVEDYVATRDPAVLSLERGGALLFSYPPMVQALLDREGFRALLPPETGVPEARPDHGRLGFLPKVLLAWPTGFAVAGLLALGVGLVMGRARSVPDEPPRETRGPGWSAGGAAWAAAGAAVVVSGLVFCWPAPFHFNTSHRLSAALADGGASATLIDDLNFALVSEHVADPSAMPGAVLALPESWRGLAYGTFMDGYATRGIFASRPFVIEADWLAVLFTGYPCAAGNALRWKLDPPDGGESVWLAYQGSNPVVEWASWSENVAAYRGWQASLYLYDGRDDPEGWLGVMPPAMTDRSTWSEDLLARLRIEQAGASHRTLAVLATMLWLLALGFGVRAVGLARRSPGPAACP